ncbi:unnamed protein product [Ceutorhynchus assimilis]|uniref:Uncharacterized protein n=1 Tax=Ceutorhynchus assimilis TaxID=467358 RepID=A0A9N9N0F6_9CUCU|nr:unnamed protein product [Ceutorhynchus assimilis]
MEINSFGDLYKITTSKNLVEYLQNLGMLKSNFPCKNCRQTCFLQTDSNNTIINTTFYCPNCKNTFSVLDGSFFESAKMPVSNILHLMWMWACEINTESAAQSMGMKKNIVVEQFRSFRGVIRWKLSQNKKLLQLGGPGHVVQIDKILLIRLRTKNNEVKQKLVISMYDTTTKKGYVQQIYNKTPGEATSIVEL